MGVLDFLSGLSPGTAAGQAAKEIAGGIFDGVDKIIKDFKLTPEQAQAYEQFKTNALLQADQIAASDRDSARKREIAVKDRTPQILALFLTTGFFGLLGYMVVYPLPTGSERVIDMMLGSLGTAWLAAIYYYFGTSAGSDKKHDLIERMVDAK